MIRLNNETERPYNMAKGKGVNAKAISQFTWYHQCLHFKVGIGQSAHTRLSPYRLEMSEGQEGR